MDKKNFDVANYEYSTPVITVSYTDSGGVEHVRTFKDTMIQSDNPSFPDTFRDATFQAQEYISKRSAAGITKFCYVIKRDVSRCE